MLPKPYSLIDKIGINRYYTLDVNDMTYVAVESVVNVPKKIRPKGVKAEFTQALKLLPLHSPIVMFLSVMMNLNSNGKRVNKMGFEEDFYDLVDIDALRGLIKNYYDTHKDEMDDSHKDRFLFPDTIQNDAVKNFISTGYNILFVDKEGSRTHTIWLVTTSDLGDVRFLELIVSGPNGYDFLLQTTTYVFDIPLIKSLMSKIANKGGTN